MTSPLSSTRIGTSLVPLEALDLLAVGAAAAPGPHRHAVAADRLQLVFVPRRVERLPGLRTGMQEARAVRFFAAGVENHICSLRVSATPKQVLHS
jgi:hypothetical protein